MSFVVSDVKPSQKFYYQNKNHNIDRCFLLIAFYKTNLKEKIVYDILSSLYLQICFRNTLNASFS